MWGNVSFFETATRPIYHYHSRYTNHNKDTGFKQQLNDLRRMRLSLAESNSKIGNQIFLNAQTERRLQELKLNALDVQRPICDFRSCSSDSVYNSQNGSFLYSESSDISSCELLGKSFSSQPYDGSSFSETSNITSSTQTCDKTWTSQSSDDSTESLDDENSFELISISSYADELALTDMLNSIFGYDKIYQYSTKKSSSTFKSGVLQLRRLIWLILLRIILIHRHACWTLRNHRTPIRREKKIVLSSTQPLANE